MTDQTPEEQRQLLYSSVLKFTSEPITLRERVLDRVVLGGLIGSNNEDPYRIGRINENIHFGKMQLRLRTETIQETLERLMDTDAVRTVELKRRHAYYLTKSATAQIATVTNIAQQDFDIALKKMLGNTSHLFDYDIGAVIGLPLYP